MVRDRESERECERESERERGGEGEGGYVVKVPAAKLIRNSKVS